MSRLRMSLFSGAGAAAASIITIVLLAKAEGKPAVRPINATSHVLWGPHHAAVDDIDGRHTIPGIAINAGAAFFWGAIFAGLLPAAGRIPASQIFARAFATSLAAAVIDYGLVPRRLRPGWELALKTRSVVMALAALGAGLAAGGFGAQAALPKNLAGEHL